MSEEGPRPAEKVPFAAPEAPTFRCPSCGGPAAKDARACVHCGSLLATKRCVRCFALSPREAERCVKCGALLPSPALVTDGAGRCPDCRLDLAAHAFGVVGYAECPRCAGLFLKREAFEAVTADADTRAKVRLAEPAPVAGRAAAAPGRAPSGAFPPVRYRKCPVCRKLMNRTNYGGGSGIVLDTCRDHGIWFDKGELSAIVAFLENGGWAKLLEREREKLVDEVRNLELRKDSGLANDRVTTVFDRGPTPGEAVGGLADLVGSLAGWFLKH